MTTYVYENVEVKKTGRTGERALRSKKIDVVIEITPVNQSLAQWKKWVHENQLYEVGEEEC